jgi:RNA polymerase sigma-70 factor, ECF subfamily
VGLALLVVLDRLTPAERLAFVLHDMFAVRFEEIARPGSPALDKQRITRDGARRALRQSTDDLARLFESAFVERHARVKGCLAGQIDMLTYLLQHVAHHRGQICMLARDLGHKFRGEDMTRLWGWEGD